MRDTISFTLQDANKILNILSDLPIRYLSVAQAVQKLLYDKFTEKRERNVTDTLLGK